MQNSVDIGSSSIHPEGAEGTISGPVKAVGSVIHSLEDPKIKGAVWRQTIREHLVTKVWGMW